MFGSESAVPAAAFASRKRCKLLAAKPEGGPLANIELLLRMVRFTCQRCVVLTAFSALQNTVASPATPLDSDWRYLAPSPVN